MPVAVFDNDLKFTETARALLVEQLYPLVCTQCVSFTHHTRGSMWVQKNAHIDAVLQLPNGVSVTVEEKIARKPHPSFALETEAHREQHKPGWMYTTTADWLVYAFVQPYGMDAYIMLFPALQAWFKRVTGAEHFHPVDTKNRLGFTTRCVLVPIDTLSRAITVSKYVLKG